MHGNRSGSCSHSTSVQPYWFHYSYCVYIKITQYLLILAATFCPVRTTLLEKACSMVRQLFCSVYWHRITSSYQTIYWKPRIIFLKWPAFHSEHFRFSEHEKRKDQNNLKPHYKIAPKGAGLPYQICENKILVLFSYTILSLYWIDFNPILKKYNTNYNVPIKRRNPSLPLSVRL